VRVPADSEGKKFPVVIDLHGHGGEGKLQRLGNTLGDSVVLVAPSGYERSWNILQEASKAPDVEFLLWLIGNVTERYPQADSGDVTIVGTSNGAGMINRLLIESPAPLPFHRVVPLVSNLLEAQYHDGRFWQSSDEATMGYDVPASPASPGPEFVYFHGTEDRTVPYLAGQGLGQQFLGAQGTTYAWASYWGETGPQLGDDEGVTTPSGTLVLYSYLGGRVQHYKVPGGGHNDLLNDEIKGMIKDLVLGSVSV